MHRIAQRIKDGADLVVHFGRQVNGVEGRDLEIFREGPRQVDADALGFGIEVIVPGAGHAALHADEVALARHAVAHLDGADMRTDVRDDPCEFVPNHHGNGNGLLRPGIPLPDVEVGAADAGLGDLDEDVVRADLRHGLVAHHETLGLLRLHQCPHVRSLPVPGPRP